MKKIGAYLLVLTTCGALVACNSGGGGDALSLSISPSTCSMTNGPSIEFDYSGLATGESAFFNFTNPSGAIHLSSCIVGSSSCPFDASSGGFYLACQEIAKNGGKGKYIFTLKQGAGNAAVTVSVTP